MSLGKFYECELKRKRDEIAAEAYKVLASFAPGRAESKGEGYSQGFIEGFIEGFTEGEAVGAQNAIKRMAAGLLAQGVEMATVQAVTQLSTEEIESLTTYSEK